MQINNYSLSNEGLKLSYSNGNGITNLEFAPFPTCNILKDLKIIKEVESNRNQEPVLIIEEGNRHEWHQFVKLFRIDTTLPLAIAEHHYKTQQK